MCEVSFSLLDLMVNSLMNRYMASTQGVVPTDTSSLTSAAMQVILIAVPFEESSLPFAFPC